MGITDVAYEDSAGDLMVLSLGGDRKLVPWLRSEAREMQGRFSPGTLSGLRWIAYVSNATGAVSSSKKSVGEVYVQAFTPGRTASGVRDQVSLGGGISPRWRRDGKELYYVARDGQLMVANILIKGSVLQIGKPYALFQTRLSMTHWPMWDYDVTPDGQRFILAEPIQDAKPLPINIVTNWEAIIGR